MPVDLEQRIATVRAAITALDAQLDANRTPYLKSQLRLALHLLDDATDGIRHATNALPAYVSMYNSFAQSNINRAEHIRQGVEAYVSKYGGPDKITEKDPPY
jgi:hypothetical protein